MLDLNKPVHTRDGRAVRVLATDVDGPWPIVIVVRDERTGREHTEVRKSDGSVMEGIKSPGDLVNTSQKVQMYVNVWRSRTGYVYFGGMHRSRMGCDRAAELHTKSDTRIGCIRIEAEERTLDGKFDA